MNKIKADWQPVLARGVRYRWDVLRAQHQLLFPEGLLVLNETAAVIVKLCDGRSIREICEDLARSFPDVDVRQEVDDFLNRLIRRQLIRDEDAP